MRKQFVKTVSEIINKDRSVFLFLCDIGVFGFKDVFDKHPNQISNIGILESSTVSIASGFSKLSFIPIIHTIAPFLVERGLEQIKIDFGYQKLRGNIATVGSSYDYASLGATHHCPNDVDLIKNIPGSEIAIPGNSYELQSLLNSSYNNENLTYFRLSEFENSYINNHVRFGSGNLIKSGNKATVICFGPTLDIVIRASSQFDVNILYFSTIKPFDAKLVLDTLKEKKILVVEPFTKYTTSSLLLDSLRDFSIIYDFIGVKPEFSNFYGSYEDHNKINGLTENNILLKLKELISK